MSVKKFVDRFYEDTCYLPGQSMRSLRSDFFVLVGIEEYPEDLFTGLGKYFDENIVTLSGFAVFPARRKEGRATNLLRWLCCLADTNQVKLKIVFTGGTLSEKQFNLWLSRYGFHPVDKDNCLVRKPCYKFIAGPASQKKGPHELTHPSAEAAHSI